MSQLFRRPSRETLRSDANEALARRLGITVDLDDPEPALEAAVQRRIQERTGSADLAHYEDAIAAQIKRNRLWGSTDP